MSFLIIAIIIMPISFIMRSVKEKREPYEIIGRSVLYTMFGLVLIFALSYFLGSSVGSQIDAQIDEAAKLLASNSTAIKTFNLEGMSTAQRETTIASLYSGVAKALPAALAILAGIVCFIEYKLIVKSKKKKNPQVKAKEVHVRDFHLNVNSLRGWLLIFIVSWILAIAGFSQGETVLLNVNLLIEAVVSLQGISFACFYMFKKGRGEIIILILTLLIFITGLGRSILFILGALDMIFNLRKKFG